METFEENNGGNLLLIFVRNCELGKVKTRLAKDIGNENALKIYQSLLVHTRDIALDVNAFRMVYYSDYIDFHDTFQNEYFLKDEQHDGDLGQKMEFSLEENFEEGYDHIICIGSDCIELSSEIINRAFEELDSHDVVIGPAKDGGYYLIGMSKLHTSLFRDKPWGTSDLLLDTILDLKKTNLSYHLLETLNDVDEVEDLTEDLKSLVGL
ncbi:MAG: TIGR04282 family arsenosugar biosynthesis glycosyltransferase [Flavobacteriales bacterium]|nr:TIGR04282 family arsenosugar biosynthesis glycosyltransferase [Flavobacteriales bacterium]